MFTKKGARKALLEIFDTLGLLGKILFILAFPVIVILIIAMIPWFAVVLAFSLYYLLYYGLYILGIVLVVLGLVAIFGKDNDDKE